MEPHGGQPRERVAAQLLFLEDGTGLQHHGGGEILPQGGVCHGERQGLIDVGVLQKHLVHAARNDLSPPRLIISLRRPVRNSRPS